MSYTNGHSIDHLNMQLKKLIEFLTPLLPLANSHLVQFISQDQWDKFLLPGMQKDLLEVPFSSLNLVSTADLYKQPADFCSSKEEIHSSLQLFLLTVKGLRAENLNILSPLPKLMNMIDDEGAKVIDVSMNQKKAYEVKKTSRLISQICKDKRPEWIVDIGSGLGYLSSALLIQYGFKVFALDSSKSNIASALKQGQRMKNLSERFKDPCLPSRKSARESAKLDIPITHNQNITLNSRILNSGISKSELVTRNSEFCLSDSEFETRNLEHYMYNLIPDSSKNSELNILHSGTTQNFEFDISYSELDESKLDYKPNYKNLILNSDNLKPNPDIIPNPDILKHDPDNLKLNPDNSIPNSDNSIPNPDDLKHDPDNLIPNPDKLKHDLDNLILNPDILKHDPDNLIPNPNNSISNSDNSIPNPDNLKPNSDNLIPNPDNLKPDPDNLKLYPDILKPNMNNLNKYDTHSSTCTLNSRSNSTDKVDELSFNAFDGTYLGLTKYISNDQNLPCLILSFHEKHNEKDLGTPLRNLGDLGTPLRNLGDFSTPLRNLGDFGTPLRNLGLVGLHTCGNLSPTSVNLFVNNPSVQFLCNIGCCYHLITEMFCEDYFVIKQKINDRPLDSRYQSPELDPFHRKSGPSSGDAGFPLCSYLQSIKYCLGRNARDLAAKPPSRLSTNDKNLKPLFWRALFDKLVIDVHGSWPEGARVGRKISKSCNTFYEYCQKCFHSIGLQNKLTEREITQFYETHKSKENQMVRFFFLKSSLAPMIETLINLDRLIYLHEQGFLNSHLVQVFDNKISPRCTAIVSLK